MRMEALLLCLLALSILACGGAPPPERDGGLPPGAMDAAALIQPELLREAVTRLAADEMEGRGPGTDGDRRARAYLAQRLQKAGYQPAFEGESWEQPFSLVGVTTDLPDGPTVGH